MRVVGHVPDVMAYGSILRVLAAQGRPERALSVLEEMVAMEVKPTTLCFTSALRTVHRSHANALRFQGGYSKRNKRRERITAHHGRMARSVVIQAENAEVRQYDGFVSALMMCAATAGDAATARAIYLANKVNIPIHVYVDETRPRNQGSALTAWELGQQNVSCEVIADNAGGLLMQQGEVDMVITGADRVAANGDVCNKIGTYLKALAARESQVPFCVAAPTSTIDPEMPDGSGIPIEERDQDEVLTTTGVDESGVITTIRTAAEGAVARNPAFDITPADLVTVLITECGLTKPAHAGDVVSSE